MPLIGAIATSTGQLQSRPALAETGGIDDFWLAEDGGVVFATHGATLARLGLDGVRAELLAEGCDACTAGPPATAQRVRSGSC